MAYFRSHHSNGDNLQPRIKEMIQELHRHGETHAAEGAGSGLDEEMVNLAKMMYSEARKELYGEKKNQGRKPSAPWSWLSKDHLVRMEHELCTPLSLILGPLYTMMSDVSLPQKYRRDLNRIHRNSLRLMNLVYDFLELARVETRCTQLQNRSIDPGPLLIREIEDMLPSLEQRGIAVRWNLDQGARFIADPARLERLLLHVLSQVSRLVPKHGRLTVSSRREGENVKLSFEGARIRPRRAERLLEPGHYIMGEGQAPGMGLILASRLARLMKGRIGVDCGPKDAASFYIELPYAENPEIIRMDELPRRAPNFQGVTPDSEVRHMPGTPKASNVIVNIGSDPVVYSWIQEVLGASYQVHHLECLDEDKLEALSPDVILLDTVLMEETINRLRCRCALETVSIVAMVSADDGLKHLGQWPDILFKPFDIKEFLAVINSALHRRKLAMELAKTRTQLRVTSQRAGLTEMVTGILHNVGNVLNTVNVSTDMVEETSRKLQIRKVARAAELLWEHLGEEGEGALDSDTVKKMAEYLDAICLKLDNSKDTLVKESGALRNSVSHICNVIALQQKMARTTGSTEVLPLEKVIETALAIESSACEHSGIRVETDLEDMPSLTLDKHKLLQVLINLLSNARHAIEAGDRERIIMIQGRLVKNNRVRINIIDTGCGIHRDHLEKVFHHGFTTKESGFGFGLHASQCAADEMGGNLICASEGPGKGARFTLEIPIKPGCCSASAGSSIA